MSFISNDSAQIYKSLDPTDLRYDHYITTISKKSERQELKNAIVIAGYPDDEGTRLNKGRPGSNEAPHAIRSFLYRTTPHINFKKAYRPIYDIGNLKIKGRLSDRHELAKKNAESIFKANNFFLSFGGSHDYAYADGSAFLNIFKSTKNKPLIVNFDAHADCRPDKLGPNSGTPFYKLLNEYQNQFHLIEIGLEKLCNNQTYIEWAKSKKAQLYFNDQNKEAYARLNLLLKKKSPVWISLDMDVFSSTLSMGTSNNWPFGFDLKDFIPFYKLLLQSNRVQGLGIYEVVPSLDPSQTTSKLAAQLAYKAIERYVQ